MTAFSSSKTIFTEVGFEDVINQSGLILTSDFKRAWWEWVHGNVEDVSSWTIKIDLWHKWWLGNGKLGNEIYTKVQAVSQRNELMLSRQSCLVCLQQSLISEKVHLWRCQSLNSAVDKRRELWSNWKKVLVLYNNNCAAVYLWWNPSYELKTGSRPFVWRWKKEKQTQQIWLKDIQNKHSREDRQFQTNNCGQWKWKRTWPNVH